MLVTPSEELSKQWNTSAQVEIFLSRERERERELERDGGGGVW